MSLLQFLILLWRIHSNRPPDARQIQALGLLAVKVAQHYALRVDWGGRYDLSRLRFPKYYPEMSGESVLVSEWIDGVTFDEKLDQGTLEYETLVDFFKIHGFYLFGMGVYHGDIHPGNLMLDRQQQIVLIDNGAISRVGDATRIGLLDFFEALANDDFTESAQRLRAMSHTALDEAKYRKFVTAFLALYRDFSGKSVGELSLTRQMMLTIRMAVEHGMTFGDDMFGIIKGLMYLDGMTLRCHPQANLMMDIRGFVDGLRRALAIPSVSTHGASPQCGVDLPVQ